MISNLYIFRTSSEIEIDNLDNSRKSLVVYLTLILFFGMLYALLFQNFIHLPNFRT